MEDHVPRHAQMGAWVLINDRWYKQVEFLENRVLSHVPAYAFVKGLSSSIAGAEEGGNMTPVLARLDVYSRIAFEIERIEDGNVVV